MVADSAHDIPPAPGACSRWTEEHLGVVRSHGLGPWLWWWLSRHPDAGAPATILGALREDYRISTVHGLVRDASLVTVLEAFETAEVPLVLLKGSYLVRFVYPDAALRPMDDVDVLVPPEHAKRSQAVLAELGYQCMVYTISPYQGICKPALPYFRAGNPPEHVDLHWALQSMDYYRFPSTAVWEEVIQSELDGYRVFFLSPEANFIHIGLHTLNHGQAIRNWLDLTLLAKQSSLDWERCVCLAERFGATRAMHWVFQELVRHWRIEPPPSLLDRVAAHAPRWIEDRVIRHRGRRYWRLFVRVERLPAWRNRFSYLFSLIFGRIMPR